MIPVNKPTINKSTSMIRDLDRALESRYVTNFGPFHNELEEQIQQISGGYTQLCNNATTGLIASISCLVQETGEIITPAFTFPATTQAIRILGHDPVYADSMPNSFNICPVEVERLITDRTKAIVAVQCYGFTDGVVELSEIAKRHGIPLIFDAAHAFTSTVNGLKLSEYADAVTYSFHATKLYNCIEGGAVVVKSKEIKNDIKSFLNFGMNSKSEITSYGFNGKLSELHAIVGIHNLQSLNNDIIARKKIYELYQSLITTAEVEHFKFTSDFNFAYFPLLISNEKQVIKVLEQLKLQEILARRYFYPLAVPKSGIVSYNLQNAKRFSDHTICLPLYPDLDFIEVKKISDIVNAI